MTSSFVATGLAHSMLVNWFDQMLTRRAMFGRKNYFMSKVITYQRSRIELSRGITSPLASVVASHCKPLYRNFCWESTTIGGVFCVKASKANWRKISNLSGMKIVTFVRLKNTRLFQRIQLSCTQKRPPPEKNTHIEVTHTIPTYKNYQLAIYFRARSTSILQLNPCHTYNSKHLHNNFAYSGS